MSANVTITVEAVQEAAKRCPQAAEVLKVLVPEAFLPAPDPRGGLKPGMWIRVAGELGNLMLLHPATTRLLQEGHNLQHNTSSYLNYSLWFVNERGHFRCFQSMPSFTLIDMVME